MPLDSRDKEWLENMMLQQSDKLRREFGLRDSQQEERLTHHSKTLGLVKAEVVQKARQTEEKFSEQDGINRGFERILQGITHIINKTDGTERAAVAGAEASINNSRNLETTKNIATTGMQKSIDIKTDTTALRKNSGKVTWSVIISTGMFTLFNALNFIITHWPK